MVSDHPLEAEIPLPDGGTVKVHGRTAQQWRGAKTEIERQLLSYAVAWEMTKAELRDVKSQLDSTRARLSVAEKYVPRDTE